MGPRRALKQEDFLFVFLLLSILGLRGRDEESLKEKILSIKARQEDTKENNKNHGVLKPNRSRLRKQGNQR